MRHSIALALVALAIFLLPESAQADEARCSDHFPDVDWITAQVDAPVSVATAGMAPEMSARFAADVARNANRIQSEIGGLEGTAACLATPELASAFSDLVAVGQRLHVGVFGEEKLLVISAVEIRTVDDAIAFGLPHIALWEIADELRLEQGYPEPLGSTIAHWYMARDTDRLPRFRSELIVTLFLDDPNPELRTADDAIDWVSGAKADPFLYDPQFVGSPMGVFIDWAVSEEGPDILSDPSQETWAALENRWRIALRDEFPRGSFGAEWGVALVVTFVSLAILLAWGKRRQNRRAAQRRPTPPVDESLFVSRHE